jgi:hypothetical protein
MPAGGRTGLRRDLEEIVQTCNSIQARQFNPFLMDVTEALSILRRHRDHLDSLQDHLLDMRAITGIARVVGLQSSQLRFQSSSLFMDPQVAKDKLDGLSRQQLAEFLLLSWHPVVELEQLTDAAFKEATDYWNTMLSFLERRQRLHLGPLTLPQATSLPELTGAGFVEEKAFAKRLQDVWEDLHRQSETTGFKDYWSFVKGRSFPETVAKAQVVSFLVSYGYANLEEKNGQLVIIPREEPKPSKAGSTQSYPIPIRKEVAF